MRAFGFAFGLLALSALPAVAKEPIKWTVSVSGGSEIEIPVFFKDDDGRELLTDGVSHGTTFSSKEYGVYLRQYGIFDEPDKRPFEYIKEKTSSEGKATYTIDKPSLGVISGTTPDGTRVFYGMCQKRIIVTCFDIAYDKKKQAVLDPIVERIARSFRKNG
ncbi:hypothetical protein X769_23880 [Mesorhizobium sp. LSJC268A00]|uniref:hypothetical protein n=1 Tax=unclassified Mesorhizobium TaxID=325217 RepID=UPI0003CEC708|nr:MULTISPECIES: hypothetical protein [unclassified Mesorhizobium]ESW99284.1 hypothetical protein X769_23880 [Mesorhizobium sp. LSJC268A00]ESZ12878.1 hypothetical protein X735_20570 [Mesorhizobium sp. L2C085B000]